MNLVQAKNINFYYRNNKTGFYLRDISFSIDRGESLSIIGPNGSGKSTLLKLLAGLHPPYSGTLQFEGKSYSDYSFKDLAQKISFVPQQTLSIFPFTVYEIVMMGRTPYLNFMGLEKKTDDELVYEAMRTVEIEHLANSGINEVSGGEAQRAFIARALVQQPDIMLLDEPSAHLDLHHQVSIYNLLKKLNEEKNIAVITVSHDLNLSGHYSNRALLINQGAIVTDDKITNVLSSANIKKYFHVDSEVTPAGNGVSVLICP